MHYSNRFFKHLLTSLRAILESIAAAIIFVLFFSGAMPKEPTADTDKTVVIAEQKNAASNDEPSHQ